MQLMTHQKEGLEFLAERHGAGLFFEMGLGKTYTILEHLHRLKSTDNPFPALIVCPLSVIHVWEEEIKFWKYPFKVINLIGTKAERAELLKEKADIYVINYEGLRIMEHFLLTAPTNFKTVIFDESHRVKDLKSQQTISAIKVSELATYKYLLTGTPMVKSPEDLWSQLLILDKEWLVDHFKNVWVFRARFIEHQTMQIRAKGGGYREIKVPIRFKNLKELEAKVSEKCIRKTKEECLDLPEQVYCRIPIHLSNEQWKQYHSIRIGLKAMLDDGTVNVTNVAGAIQKMRQICNGFIYAEDKVHLFKDNPKLHALKELVADIGKKKIVIFTHFTYDKEIICNEKFDNHLLLNYDGDSLKRKETIRKFQEGSEPMIFLANIETAKEGITLTAAHTVIYFSNTYSYASRYQSEARCHRKGQTNKVTYYNLACKDTIEERVLDLLQIKKDAADKVTGDVRRLAQLAVGENGSGISQLELE